MHPIIFFFCFLTSQLCLLMLDNNSAVAQSTTSTSKSKNAFRNGCLQEMENRRRLLVQDSQEEEIDNDTMNGRGKKGYVDRDDPARSAKEGPSTGALFFPRVCNSDDELLGNNDCDPPVFDEYFEVRVNASPWDESLVLSWIFQIVLSEILSVPTTIDGDMAQREDNFALSFYDEESRFQYGATVYPMESLLEADRLNGDCTKSSKSCAHVIPSAWEAGQQDAYPFTQSGEIATSSQINGVVGRIGFIIPFFTAKRDAGLTIHFGLAGEENREKLASTFKTPANWGDYCSFEYANCADGDDVAKSFPQTEEEANKYFVENLYSGHFYIADSNNCTLNKGTCTGNVIGPPCDYSNYIESQLFWNNIHLKSTGPLHHGGYTLAHIMQIYKAAVATRSDVFVWYWTPDAYEQSLIDTENEMIRVTLPRATPECISNRQTSGIIRCSEKFEERVGDPKASCDYTKELPTKVISRGLVTATNAAAIQSPALEFLKAMSVKINTMDNIFGDWEKKKRSGLYDDPIRESVCTWVYDNTDYLKQYIPKGYPRKKEIIDFRMLSIVGSILGGTTLIVLVISIILIKHWQHKSCIRRAQVEVLLTTAFGYGLLSIAGIIGSIEPSTVSCTLNQWFARLGYMLGFLPTLIRLSTINDIMKAGSRSKRVYVDKHKFKRVMSMMTFLLIIFLSMWSIFDIPHPKKEYQVLKASNNVKVFSGCASNSSLWDLCSFSLEIMILFSTTLLTYFCREIIEEMNESHSLSLMVYSHFLFLVMRILMYGLMMINTLMMPYAMYIKIVSLLISADALVAICLYFFPKFHMAITGYDRVRQPVVKLASSGAGPNLELPEECKFHAFASHVWSTGQAQMHAIVRKLQLHMPEIKVWLDVDHLHDISSLEESVAESAIFLLYYSKNYFRSKNCCREVDVAIKMNKPIIIIYDGDESTMSAMRQEFISESKDASDIWTSINKLFDGGSGTLSRGMHIQWLKEIEFNAATLNQIYFFILSNLPYYRKYPKELSSGLLVPGEMNEVSFESPADILVYKYNVGAKEIILELKDLEELTSTDMIHAHDAVEYLRDLNIKEDPNDGKIEMARKIESTYLFIYLNKYTFEDYQSRGEENIVWVIETCLRIEIKVVLVREMDINAGACRFDLLYDQAPSELYNPPYNLFNDLAIPMYSNAAYRTISLKKICVKFGAFTPEEDDSIPTYFRQSSYTFNYR